MIPFRNILVVQTAFAGDVVLVTPLIRATKLAFPESGIDVLLTPETAVLFKNNPYVRSVLVYDKRGHDRGIAPFVRWVERLRTNRYDLALVPHRSMRSALLVYLARIRRRIGFSRSSGFFLYTDAVPYPKTIHEVDRNLLLLRRTGWKKSVPAPVLFPGAGEKKAVDLFLSENGIAPGEPFAVLAPGSLWPTKRWPAERYRETADILYRRHGLRSVLVGGKEDARLGEALAAGSGKHLLNAIGRFSLLESAELIRRSQLLLANDSAPLHLAVAVGTRAAGIFGPTVPDFGFAPYGSGHAVIQKELECRPCSIHGGYTCPKGHFRCMVDISAETVANVLERFLPRGKTA